jgi:DNA (cytosine-5)-methyltransferase 1
MKKKTKEYRAIDLFAGIGGIRLGFQQAFGNQIKFVFSNEIDKNACLTYKANFGDDPEGDITKIDPKDIPEFDILLGGFPCQAFSIAGHQMGFKEARGTLFYNVAKIIEEKKPEAFLLENVKNLTHHDSGRTFTVIKNVLEIELGYHIHYKILNAKDYGVPQNRERIFIVGFKKNLKFEFPPPLSTIPKLDDILEKNVDESYYISHQYWMGMQKHRARHEALGHGFGYEVRPRDGIANAIVVGGMGKERNLVKDVILPNCWKQEGDDIQLRNKEGIRKMTEREWARLQGYPDSFQFPVAKVHIYKQLGNSVAVPVIKAIAEQMKKSMENKIIEKGTKQLTLFATNFSGKILKEKQKADLQNVNE